MSVVKMTEMLEAGCHFGHKTNRWDPRMKPYVYGVKNGIYIIDLQQTVDLFDRAYRFVRDAVGRGAKLLFVGTKRQAQQIIKEEAERCGMYYVNDRWLGGMLTNFKTIKNSIDTLKRIERLEAEGKFGAITKKEALQLVRKRVKLDAYLSGIKEMIRPPELMFVVDVKRERIAVQEANTLNLQVIAPVDTNCNPELVSYPIPGNDDGMRAIRLYVSRIADACLEGQQIYQEFQKEEEKRRLEERARAAASGEIEAPQEKGGAGRGPQRRRGAGPTVNRREGTGRRKPAGGVPAGVSADTGGDEGGGEGDSEA